MEFNFLFPTDISPTTKTAESVDDGYNVVEFEFEKYVEWMSSRTIVPYTLLLTFVHFDIRHSQTIRPSDRQTDRRTDISVFILFSMEFEYIRRIEVFFFSFGEKIIPADPDFFIQN